jgi:hypothetical protein
MTTYLYDPVDGSSATYILRRYCDVLRIDSLAAARQYIIDARKEGSKEAYDSLRAAVLGLEAPVSDYVSDADVPSPWFRQDTPIVSVAPRRGPADWLNLGRPARLVAKGGADRGDLVEKLQQFADACHDFGSVDPGPDKDMLVILERSIFGAEVEYMEPPMTRGDIADKNKFIKAVTACDGFKFKIGGEIHVVDSNPMKDRNLEAAITQFAKGSPGKLVSRVVNDELQTVDIFFGKVMTNHKLIVMKNIHVLRGKLADFFGDPFAEDRPKFMVDQDVAPWAREEDPHRHLFAWMAGFGHILVAMDEHFKGVVPLTDIGFNFVYCDATVYDGAAFVRFKDSVSFSPEPTGVVFHEGSTANVEFTRVDREGDEKHAFGYTVSTTDVPKNPLTAGNKNPLMNEVCRDGFVIGHTRDFKIDHSVETMSRQVKRLVKDGFDVASPIAQKTAGDWGQIEHCKANNIVFVTCDRLTALRAASRECSVLLVKHHDYANDKYAQYSFCMFGTEEARQALTAPMKGGSRPESFITNVVLASVILACAILGNGMQGC